MTLNKGKNSSVCILLIWTVPFGEMKVVKVESIFQQSKTDANELFLHPDEEYGRAQEWLQNCWDLQERQKVIKARIPGNSKPIMY
ncbi:hypothetical protein MKW98_029442, partial [Papaver atlanticum]